MVEEAMTTGGQGKEEEVKIGEEVKAGKGSTPKQSRSRRHTAATLRNSGRGEKPLERMWTCSNGECEKRSR